DDLVTGVQTCALPILRMRSERSYSGLAPVAAGCTSRGSREEGIASLAFAGSLTAAPSFVRELLDAFSRAQPVPSTASITKALRQIGRASCRERGEKSG